MLLGVKRRIAYFCVNRMMKGTNSKHWERKRQLLNWIGHDIGEGTKVVGPVRLYGTLHTGKDVWLGESFTLHGLGHVYIGDCCDIAPDVTCLTGSHEIGEKNRRAGEGTTGDIHIGNGCWICARSTIAPGAEVGKGCVVAACSCVVKDIEDNVLVGGVPAKIIRKL